jgi:hypothetical protein
VVLSKITAGVLALALTLVSAQLFAADPPASSKTPAKPAQAGKDGWEEIDHRLVFLTVQLSTIESSISATDKALKLNGYQKIAKEAAADQARHNNELMDRLRLGPRS